MLVGVYYFPSLYWQHLSQHSLPVIGFCVPCNDFDLDLWHDIEEVGLDDGLDADDTVAILADKTLPVGVDCGISQAFVAVSDSVGGRI